MTQVPSFSIIVDLSTPTGLWTWLSKIYHFHKSADLFAIHLDALNVWGPWQESLGDVAYLICVRPKSQPPMGLYTCYIQAAALFLWMRVPISLLGRLLGYEPSGFGLEG